MAPSPPNILSPSAESYPHRRLGVQVVSGKGTIEDQFALAAAPAARELVPHGSVHGVVTRVETRQGDQTARAAQQLLGKLERGHHHTLPTTFHPKCGCSLAHACDGL